jgi:hypothetical protein
VNEGCEHRPVRPVHVGCWGGSAKDGDFMAQHEKFDVFGCRCATEQQQEAEDLHEDQVERAERHARDHAPARKRCHCRSDSGRVLEPHRLAGRLHGARRHRRLWSEGPCRRRVDGTTNQANSQHQGTPLRPYAAPYFWRLESGGDSMVPISPAASCRTWPGVIMAPRSQTPMIIKVCSSVRRRGASSTLACVDDYWRSPQALERKRIYRWLETVRAALDDEPRQKGRAGKRQARPFRAAVREALVHRPQWPRHVLRSPSTFTSMRPTDNHQHCGDSRRITSISSVRHPLPPAT